MKVEKWVTASGRIELKLTREQAHKGSHIGRCEEDIRALRVKLDPDVLRTS